MRIAHLSDPHLLDLAGVKTSRLVSNKRLTGFLTIKLHRGNAHQGRIVEKMVDDINALGVDHVVITGDITNLALEPEFEYARRVFSRFSHGTDGVSVIPGNHDVYTRGSQRELRFSRYFGGNITSDLPIAHDASHPSGPFPFVRLRGPLAIIGLSTSIARAPLIAAGLAGREQMNTVTALLDHPEVRRRTPVFLVHHPLFNPPGFIPAVTHGLPEGRRIRRLLGGAVQRGLVLHGHMHDRLHREFHTTRGGSIHHIGATSASLVHRSRHRMAGYNVYDFADDGQFVGASAHVWNEATEKFSAQDIQRVAAVAA